MSARDLIGIILLTPALPWPTQADRALARKLRNVAPGPAPENHGGLTVLVCRGPEAQDAAYEWLTDLGYDVRPGEFNSIHCVCWSRAVKRVTE